MNNQQVNRTGSGIQENLAGLLCYVLGWVTGIVFLVIEKENRFVRFHAAQSIVVFGTFTVVMIVLSFIPFVGWILNWLLSIAALITWVVLIYKAYQGQMVKVPIAGNIAENLTQKK